MRRIASAVMLVTCAALLVACSAASSRPASATHGLEGDLAKQYTDIGSLARDSAAVIVAKPTNQAVREPADAAGESGVFVTVTTVDVVKILKGSTPSSTLPVRQLLVDGDTALAAGMTYVLFITPFTFATAQYNGEWVLTGAVGKYAVNGANVSLAPGAQPGLPQRLAMTDLIEQLG